MLANGANYPANYPVTAASQPEVYALLRALARQEEVDGFSPEEAREWVLAYYGAHTVKKVVTALGEGAAGIMIGNTEDWMVDSGQSLRDGQVFLLGGSTTMGMTEVTHPAGYDLCAERQAGEARPALTNLGLVLEFLGGEAVEEVERVGANEGPRGYALRRGGVTSWVLWNEDGELHLPGDPAEAVESYALTLPEGVRSVRLTRTVLTMGAEPVEEMVSGEGGVVTLELTAAPVIVSPE